MSKKVSYGSKTTALPDAGCTSVHDPASHHVTTDPQILPNQVLMHLGSEHQLAGHGFLGGGHCSMK